MGTPLALRPRFTASSTTVERERCPGRHALSYLNTPIELIREIRTKVMDQAQQHCSVVEDESPREGSAAKGLAKTIETIAQPPSATMARPVDRGRLINKLNYLNFQNRTILLAFEHRRYGHILRIEARPQPCRGNQLRCTWVDPRGARGISKYYDFAALCIPDEQKLLQGNALVRSMDEEGIVIELPESCTEVHSRRVLRYPCTGIRVQLLRNAGQFDGTLVDFSPLSFRVRVSAIPPQTFGWLGTGSPVMVVLSNTQEVLYSGDCRIVSRTAGRKTREYVLEPMQDSIQRFEPKKYRSARHKLVPTPTVVFDHPLTGKLTSLKVLDLCGSGLAVEESARNAVLMPGMMIPDLSLCLTSNTRFPCRAQVVYRQFTDPDSEETCVKYGLALLDMDVAAHVQLIGLLNQAHDRRSYVCNQVDMDELWNFFFETGFIYPQKYDFIEKNREKIKRTYDKLYAQSPTIARHFIYQDRGKILGHMGMLRFYDSTWLIHHHAARSNYSYKAGLNVLHQIGGFITDSCRFSFMHMEYVICFYRPENHFPRSIFGGVCRSIDDARRCSEVTFAYCHLKTDTGNSGHTPAEYGWRPVDDDDLRELSSFCRHEAGGLMVGALDLEPGCGAHGDLSDEFGKLGLRRERRIYALQREDCIQAIAMVNLSDIGLNLSDLTNSITLFVLDPQELTSQLVRDALSVLMQSLGQEQLPVLIFPEAAAESLKMPVEKRYVMWSLMPHFSDGFHQFTSAILRVGRKDGGSHGKRRSPPL